MSASFGSDPMERRQGEGVSRDRTSVDRPRTDTQVDRHHALAVEKARYGGVKVGSAFFGWLTATGIAVLLTAIVAAAGTAIAISNKTNVGHAAAQATQRAKTVGVVGTIVLLVILFVAYFCGGYVAGRMARFNGARQGVAVWLWAVLVAVAVAVAGAAGGSKYDVLGQLNSFPRIPVDAGTLTAASIIALIVLAVTSLVGAILGGLAGMRFHRRVDDAGLGVPAADL